jgi:hypothetical protein
MRVLVLIILLVPKFVFSQIESNGENSIEINVKSGISYRSLITENEKFKSIIDYLNKNEFPVLGYRADFQYNFVLNKKFELSTGIGFSSFGKRIEIEYSIFPDQFNSGYSFDTAILQNSYSTVRKDNYYYLDLPLNIKYFIIKKEINFYINSGLIFNSYIKTRYKDISNDLIEFNRENYMNRFNLTYLIGLGIEFKVNEKIKLNTNFGFDSMIYSIDDSDIKEIPYLIGLNFGMKYKL